MVVVVVVTNGEGGVGILHQNLTSASSALQGLLKKLSAVFDDMLPSSAMGSASSSHQSGRLKKILSGLRADGEEGKQVEALTQLCDMLSIGTEDSLSSFSVDSFAPVAVAVDLKDQAGEQQTMQQNLKNISLKTGAPRESHAAAVLTPYAFSMVHFQD